MEPSEAGTATPRDGEVAAPAWAPPDSAPRPAAAPPGRDAAPRPAAAPPGRDAAPGGGRPPLRSQPPGRTGGAVPTGGPFPTGGPAMPARPYRDPYPPPAWPPSTLAGRSAPTMRATSGLFPSGPPRPIYREPLPARPGPASLGVIGGSLWMLLFAVLASTARGYAWASIVAAVLAWLVGGVLMRYGDRGVATGVALAAGTGLSIAGIVVVVHLAQGHWLLW